LEGRSAPVAPARRRSAGVPNLFGLRADPFERSTNSFEELPPRAKAASFTVSDAMEKIETASPNQNSGGR
jgi:hypothetical protein